MIPSRGDAASFCGVTAGGFGRAHDLGGGTGAGNTADGHGAAREGVAGGNNLGYVHKITSVARSSNGVSGWALTVVEAARDKEGVNDQDDGRVRSSTANGGSGGCNGRDKSRLGGSTGPLNVDSRRGWHAMERGKSKEARTLYCNRMCRLECAWRLGGALGLGTLVFVNVWGMAALVDAEEARIDTIGVSRCGEHTSEREHETKVDTIDVSQCGLHTSEREVIKSELTGTRTHSNSSLSGEAPRHSVEMESASTLACAFCWLCNGFAENSRVHMASAWAGALYARCYLGASMEPVTRQLTARWPTACCQSAPHHMASALAGASCIKVLLWRIWPQGALHKVGACSTKCNRHKVLGVVGQEMLCTRSAHSAQSATRLAQGRRAMIKVNKAVG
jgi:hypothetical protein